MVEQLAATWTGLSSQSMATTMNVYISWLNSTASRAEATADCIHAVVNAYGAALSSTVPPALIAANRSLLATLIATNLLGQNTAKIAQLEAEYELFWAQDSAAMNTYAATALPAAAQSPNLTAPVASQPPAQPPTQATGLLGLLTVASDIGDVVSPAIMEPTIIGTIWGAEGVAYGAEYSGLALERLTYAEEQDLPQDFPFLTPPPLPYTPMASFASSDSLSGLSVPKSWTQSAPEMRLAFAEEPAFAASSSPLSPASPVSPMLGQTPPVLAPITSAGNNRNITPKNPDDAKRKAARGRRPSLHD